MDATVHKGKVRASGHSNTRGGALLRPRSEGRGQAGGGQAPASDAGGAPAVVVLSGGFVLLALACEVWLMWLLDRGLTPHTVAAAGFVHLAAAASMGCAAIARWEHLPVGSRRALIYGVFALTALLPLCGVLLTPALLHAGVRRRAGAQGGHVPLEVRRAQANAQLREGQRARQVVPADSPALMDAILDANNGVRLAAVEALRGDNSPHAVKLLCAARGSASADVRMLAAESLDLIASDHEHKIALARATSRAKPDDPALRWALAEALLAWTALGIESSQAAMARVEEARENCEVALSAAQPSDGAEVCEGQILCTLGGALLQLGCHERAARAFRKSIERSPGQRRAIEGLRDSLFFCRDFESLRQLEAQQVEAQEAATLPLHRAASQPTGFGEFYEA